MSGTTETGSARETWARGGEELGPAKEAATSERTGGAGRACRRRRSRSRCARIHQLVGGDCVTLGGSAISIPGAAGRARETLSPLFASVPEKEVTSSDRGPLFSAPPPPGPSLSFTERPIGPASIDSPAARAATARLCAYPASVRTERATLDAADRAKPLFFSGARRPGDGRPLKRY